MRAPHRNQSGAVLTALLAGLLYGLNSPISKLLVGAIPPMFLTAFLYLGAAIGMTIVQLIANVGKAIPKEPALRRGDAPWVAAMVLLDLAAPVLLLYGLRLTTATNASLLSNFELVATALIARLFFRESIGKRLWLAMGVITLASLVLSADVAVGGAFSFSMGSLLILCACLCWGLENNCSSRLSSRNPVQIVMVKGFGSGLIALVIALATAERTGFSAQQAGGALLLGFVSFGLSIYFYVRAQRSLGAARTGMYYAAAPFFGVLLSLALLGEHPGPLSIAGLVIMAAGTLLVIFERHSHTHVHAQVTHEHAHNHLDGHHMHAHEPEATPGAVHTHAHVHEELEHEHEHTPDLHHRHGHA